MTGKTQPEHTESTPSADAHGGSAQERGFLAAAHNQNVSEEARKHAASEYVRLHEERTGIKLDPDEVMRKGKTPQEHTGSTPSAEAHGGTAQERGFLAAAHNQSVSEEARKHAASEYVRLHEERTGVKLDPDEVMRQGKTH